MLSALAACLAPLSLASAIEPVVLLSRYPVGDMPVEPQTIGAILTLGELGGAAELPLLDSVVERERSELSNAATVARDLIRARRRQSQRAEFANHLPDWPELERAAPTFLGAHTQLDRETRASATYAAVVLGIAPTQNAHTASRLPELGTRLPNPLELENRGEVQLAVQSWALHAAAGSEHARTELDSFGIDAERLLLGMLSLSRLSGSAPMEAGLLNVLVWDGDQLTVEVLSTQALTGTGSNRATATDALVRMLDSGWRDAPLDPISERAARMALRNVSTSGPPGIREIALEGL